MFRVCKKFFLLTVAVCAYGTVAAQDVAVKTNLAYDAAATIDLGAEVKLAPKATLDVSGGYNPWTFSHGKKWKNWFVQPEARYWFCDAWDGHFLAVHAIGGQYNMGGIHGLPDFLGSRLSRLADRRYQGWFAGAGIGYGYDWILSRHWNLEAEIAVGWLHTRFDTYRCAGCGKKTAAGKHHNYYGPTKAAINLIYIF